MKIDVRKFVEHVLRRASEKGAPSLADVTVDDILFLANCAGVRHRQRMNCGIRVSRWWLLGGLLLLASPLGGALSVIVVVVDSLGIGV